MRQLSVFGLMLALAVIDFVGALYAQSYADRRQVSALIVGCALSVVLFVVYALALRLADLSIVTMGWIVMLQVALLAMDVVRRGLHLSPAQWSAAALVLMLQVYLVASTEGAGPAGTGATVQPPQTSTVVMEPGRSPVTR